MQIKWASVIYGYNFCICIMPFLQRPPEVCPNLDYFGALGVQYN